MSYCFITLIGLFSCFLMSLLNIIIGMNQIVSDIGLFLCVIGSVLIILILWIPYFIDITPVIHISIIILGLALLFSSFIFMVFTKDRYHIVTLNNGFPLKLDHLIVFICVIAISLSFIINIQITILIYDFTISWSVLLFYSAFLGGLIFFLIRRKKNTKQLSAI